MGRRIKSSTESRGGGSGGSSGSGTIGISAGTGTAEQAGAKWRHSGETVQPMDPNEVYQRVVEFEEAEAKRRLPEKDAEIFYETCNSLRKMFKIIDEHKTKHPNADPSEISEVRDKASLAIVTLKKLNRLEKIRTKTGRDTLHKEKQKLDSKHLLLQNLLYEASHLDKEATKCLQFKSKDEEIDLVPVEEFYQNAPEKISRQNVTKDNPHQLRLARLEWELHQRRDLSEAFSRLQESSRKISASLTEDRARLNGLNPKLQDALKAAKPLQEALGMNSLGNWSSTRGISTLLPAPLFLLHARALAFSEAFKQDVVKVSISGDETEAKELGQVDSLNIVSDSDSDQDVEAKEDEDNQDKKKRHRRTIAKLSKKERANERLQQVLKVHPLKVDLAVKQGDMSIILNFSYLTHLKIVTVLSTIDVPKQLPGVSAGDVLNSFNILQSLYPNDDGSDSPHPATDYILKSAGVEGGFVQFVSELGRPYIWAQRMCGLDFMAEKVTPDSKLCIATIENVLVELQKSLKRRLTLMAELIELESGNLPPLEGSANVRLMGSLTQWQAISWSEYSQATSTSSFIKKGLVVQNDMFYRAIVTRQSAKLVAFVALKGSYPKRSPIFSLTLHWNGTYNASTDDDIRDIERCVNTDYGHIKKVTLIGQITKLITCLDILLEAVGSSEFPPDKVMFRPVRGRNRTKPYKFLKQGSGVFVQY